MTQTKQVLENLKAVLEAGGSTLGDVVKTTVFLKSMDEFAAMNEVYAEYFSAKGGSLPAGRHGASGGKDSAPARSTVEVARLPRDAKVEIEVIAVVRER